MAPTLSADKSRRSGRRWSLLDSISAADEVYGRLRRISQRLGIETPCVSAVAALSAEGNGEALGKLLDFAQAATDSNKPLVAPTLKTAEIRPGG